MKLAKKAVILLSGGMDSITCMAIAQSEGYELFPLSFDYGQKHRSELKAAQNIAEHFSATHKVFEVPALGALGGSALTDDSIAVEDGSQSTDIPSTYVPARNIIFLSVALGYAEIIGAEAIFVGVSSVDYSGYPDCRPEFIDAFQIMADRGTKAGALGEGIQIKTPLLYLSKAETIQAGQALGIDYRMSITCYRADQEGRACGTCDSCDLRRKGFEDLGVEDQTLYA